MKKVLLAAAFLIGGMASAMAACSGPANMHDFLGTSFLMSLSTNAGDGNCSSNVTVISAPTTTVTGTITANAGTNLNTSLLAIETGGNLASIVTQLGAVTASPTSNTVNDRLKTINTTLGTPFQAGGTIGNTSFASTQSGTWTVQPGNTANSTPWLMTDSATSNTGSAVPAKASFMGAQSGANLVGLIQASASAPINVSTATTTQIVALSGSTKIYVTSFDVVAGGTGNATFVYGTGSACGTGTTSLTGPYNLTAQSGIAKGNGLGPVIVVPAGNALCITTSQAVQMSGSVSYTQF